MRRIRNPAVLRLTAAGIVLWLGAGVPYCHCSQAGELDAVRDAVRDGSDEEKQTQKRKRPRRTDCDDDDEPSFFSQLLSKAFVFTVTSPWWLPHLACDDHLRDDTYFPRFPYEAGHKGYLIINPSDALGADQVSIRASSEFGTDFDDLSRIGTRLIFDTSSRFGLDAEWNQWIEQTSSGDDRLDTGDFNLVYRFAQNERVQFRSGLGFNWLADSQEANFGFNFTYGVDLFPTDPVIVSGTLDLGSLGEALFFHGRATAGIVVGPAELFTGYDYQRIGNVDLHGLLAGVQLWF